MLEKIENIVEEARKWWGIKQKITFQYVGHLFPSFLSGTRTEVFVDPLKITEDLANICIFDIDRVEKMTGTMLRYMCYHELGHVKFFLDGFPVFHPLGYGVVTSQILNVAYIIPEEVIPLPNYPTEAITICHDLYERVADYLVEYRLVEGFPTQIIENLKQVITENRFADPLIPKKYRAYLQALDAAQYWKIYEHSKFHDANFEEIFSKDLIEVGKSLPAAPQIFDGTKAIFAGINFTTDEDKVLGWIREFYALLPKSVLDEMIKLGPQIMAETERRIFGS